MDAPIKCPACGRRNADTSTHCYCGRPLIDVPSDDPVSASIVAGSTGRVSLRPEVVVADVRMSFWSMVIFMVKWAIASIPAAIILVAVVLFAAVFLGGIFSALGWLR
jgi:hypothetical protein